MNVSIIICCYNSENVIREALKHLALQDSEGLKYEVILVDNNCTDDTVAIAQNVWNECGSPFPIRIVNESQSGLSYARRAGVLAAQGEVIVFCDDDNHLHPKYVATSHNLLIENKEIGVAGGRGYAVADGELPYWFTTYQGSFAVGVQALYSCDITRRKYVWGAGMAFRRLDYVSLIKSGFKNIGSDRKGNTLHSGGDSEICRWFVLVGKRLYYSEDLVFGHYMPDQRLTKDYLERLQQGLSLSPQFLKKYDLVTDRVQFGVKYAIKMIVRGLFRMNIGLLQTGLSLFFLDSSVLDIDKSLGSIKKAYVRYQREYTGAR